MSRSADPRGTHARAAAMPRVPAGGAVAPVRRPACPGWSSARLPALVLMLAGACALPVAARADGAPGGVPGLPGPAGDHAGATAVALPAAPDGAPFPAVPQAPVALPPPPSELYGALYRQVELEQIFSDQKTFADAVATVPPAQVMRDYDQQSKRPGFELRRFTLDHFTMPERADIAFKPAPDRHIKTYIADMWNVLLRQPDREVRWSSLLPLPFPYVVPGGRFSEIYYWDSYFTMLGLERSGRHDLTVDMLRNMASLIDRYGHIPNGNRSYYLSRSEPPFFACMIDLVAARDGDGVYLRYLPELRREYDYWMEGADALQPGQAHRHVVRLHDGAVLNRYWDDRDTPRDESYREDVETAARSHRPPAEMYRDLRAAGESGWDFSSRWFADGRSIETVRTTKILPVDLNSIVLHMEQTLARMYGLKHDTAQQASFEHRAADRARAIRRLMWDPTGGMFTDYVWQDDTRNDAATAAMVVPLFFGLATQAQADATAHTIRARLLRPGGMTTSDMRNGQQWDAPNGWAPMQWMAVIGLRRYGQDALAEEIARRWIEREIAAYASSGVLLEKYNVRDARTKDDGGGGGGEYPLQVGFGWTNGVLVNLLDLYPRHAHQSLQAHPAAAR
ncbi:alpha,alpha-trehalase TreF [Rhizosaccharibacter radicis]|uniref:Alpha,alpha-trehalase TreF n=1 Tax=Rhizosaccharibacter radicis TaxID=2782605 RepID=A0ABT1VZT5_9PROT|nr:alpha,alpha-trehalase TreF [Acetobacteraceae bacterium KSS12]